MCVTANTIYYNEISLFTSTFFAFHSTALMKPRRANIWKTSGLLEPEIDPVKFRVLMPKKKKKKCRRIKKKKKNYAARQNFYDWYFIPSGNPAQRDRNKSRSHPPPLIRTQRR